MDRDETGRGSISLQVPGRSNKCRSHRENCTLNASSYYHVSQPSRHIHITYHHVVTTVTYHHRVVLLSHLEHYVYKNAFTIIINRVLLSFIIGVRQYYIIIAAASALHAESPPE